MKLTNTFLTILSLIGGYGNHFEFFFVMHVHFEVETFDQSLSFELVIPR